MTYFDSPSPIIARLADIEDDLATRQNDYETAARDRAKLIRDWDHRLALARRTAKASDADGRKAAALVMAIEQDDLYERLKNAEGEFEALRAVTRTLETRATIGQSILRAQGRA